MNTLILYDSAFGNTEQVAKAIALGARRLGSVRVRHIDTVNVSDLKSADVVVVGSPTQGGRPTQKLQQFLSSLPRGVLSRARVAAFDTRFAVNEHGFGLKLLMKRIGFAAPRIAAILKDKGGMLAIEPEGFIVEDKDGPLKIGELKRATQWIKQFS